MAPNHHLHLRSLADAIVNGRCILFLGAGVHAAPRSHHNDPVKMKTYPPQGPALAKLLLSELGEDDDGDVKRAAPEARQQVEMLSEALALEQKRLQLVLDDPNADGQLALDILRECYANLRELTEKPADLSNGTLLRDLSDLTRVTQYIETQTDRATLKGLLYRHIEKDRQPSGLLKILASLPFRVIITTNFDSLFDQTLRVTPVADGETRLKQPRIESYSGRVRQGPPSLKGWKPTPETPYLYKMHGDFDHPASIVVTDKDYIEFLVRLSKNDHGLPTEVSDSIPNCSILFLGYSLRDQNLRVLLKSIYGNMDTLGTDSSAGALAHYAVSRTPDPIILETLKPVPTVHAIRAELWDFVKDLAHEVKKAEAQR